MNTRKNSIIYRIFGSEKTDGFVFSVFLATLFTAGLCSNILDIAYKYTSSQADNNLHVDFNWVFWIGAVVILFYLIRDYILTKRLVTFDFALVLLVQSLIFVGIIAYHNEDYSTIAYTWLLPVAYVVGKLVIGNNIAEANKRIVIIVYVFMVALFLAVMLDFYNFFKYSKMYGYPMTEWWPGFMTDLMQNRCGMSLGLFFVNTSIWYAIFKRKQNPVMFVVMIVGMIISQYWGIEVQSRTITLLPILSLMVVLALILYDKRKFIPKSFWIISGVSVVALIAFVLIAFFNNWFNLRTIYNNSEWGAELLQNERFVMDWNGFKLMLQNPTGKFTPPDNEWYNPHNTFLQYGRVNGIAVFILLEIFKLITLKDAIVMSKKENKYSDIKYLLIPAFVCLNVNFSMDPNGYVQRFLWMMLLLVNGIIRGWNQLNYNIIGTKKIRGKEYEKN